MTKQYDNFADLITFTRASTGTFLDSDGLLKTATTNTPRIEFDINGNRNGLLIEEARTNLMLYSEEFDNAGWGKSNTTISANSVMAPDGTLTADEATSTGSDLLSQQVTVSGSPVATYSQYFQRGNHDWVRVGILNGANEIRAWFNISSGQVGTTSTAGTGVFAGASIVDAGDGWYRCSLSGSLASAPSYVCLSASATGDGVFTRVSSGVRNVWGAQLEAGSFPTSYIPTAGAAATRAADVASIPTSAFGYNADKGTVVVDFEVSNYVSGSRRLFSLNTDSQNRMDGLLVNSGQFQQFVFVGNVGQVATSTANGITNNEPSKAAAVYALNDFASVLDGGAIEADTSGTVPSVNTLSIGTSPNNTWANGHIKSIQYYPRRLTNAQIVRLTS